MEDVLGKSYGPFKAPREPAPTTRLRSHIKQLNRERLSPEAISILDSVFTGFRMGYAPPQRGGWTTEQTQHVIGSGAGGFGATSRTLRRYDGDISLPPGRYHTLCDLNGDDGGTLAREMEWYVDAATAGGLVQVYDHGVAAERWELFNLMRVKITSPTTPTNEIFIRFTPFGVYSDEVTAPVYRVIETVVRDEDIENVLDLRRPASLRWLLRVLSTLTTQAAPRRRAFNRRSIHEVSDLLPSMLDQNKGGGTFHRIVGQLLRQMGIAGLVFPSARTDVELHFQKGEPTSWNGWSFVDYRDAPLGQSIPICEDRPRWPRKLVVEGCDGPAFAAAWSSHVKWKANGFRSGAGALTSSGVKQRIKTHRFANAAIAAFLVRFPHGAQKLGLPRDFLADALTKMSAREAESVAAMILFTLVNLEQARTDLEDYVRQTFKRDIVVGGILATCLDRSKWAPSQPLLTGAAALIYNDDDWIVR